MCTTPKEIVTNFVPTPGNLGTLLVVREVIKRRLVDRNPSYCNNL